MALSQDIQLLVSRQLYMMVLIMMLTLMSYHLRWQVLWRSKGFLQANPALLEPIMKVEVETPEDYMGDIMGDLNRRRGMVQGMDDLPGGTKSIRAEVPLAEMFGYATQMRSMSQGRATYSMEFLKYQETPKMLLMRSSRNLQLKMMMNN